MQQALSASNIKYLLALRSLCGPSNEIRCVSVADALGISKASVHAMMNALKEKNLIEKNHYGMVHFTPEGRSLADQYAACYDVLAGYLHRVSSEEPPCAPRCALSLRSCRRTILAVCASRPPARHTAEARDTRRSEAPMEYASPCRAAARCTGSIFFSTSVRDD